MAAALVVQAMQEVRAAQEKVAVLAGAMAVVEMVAEMEKTRAPTAAAKGGSMRRRACEGSSCCHRDID